MSHKNFLISGKAIEASAQSVVKLPVRKFYNKEYFHEINEYQHEVANHYRDFKLRRRIRRKRRSKVNL